MKVKITVLGSAVFRSGLTEVHAFPLAWSSACCPLVVGLVETLVEAAVGSRPWLSSRTFDCRCYAALNIADGLERLLWGSQRVGIPFFDVCEQAAANLRCAHRVVR